MQIMFKNICRLCLSTENSDKFVSLIEKESANGISCYGESVKRFAQISIEKNDKLPKNMCQKCLFLLKCAIYFKFRCENSEKILTIRMQQHVNKRRKETNLSAEIHQNSPYECSNIRRPSSKKQQPYYDKENSSDNNFDNIFPNEDSDSDSRKGTNDDAFKLFKRNLNMLRNNASKPKKYVPTKIAYRKRQKIIKRDKYECEICKKVLANPVTYSNHMEYHSGCRIICEHCGKGFPVISRLQIHQIAVHGTGPYLPCQYCTYKAPTKPKLTEHERLHTGERPFTCDKCGLTFRRRAIWKKHMIHHSEKTVQCPRCPRKFFTIQDMQAHSNNIHERMYMYSCHKCNTTYAKTDTVRKHLTEVHGIPREMQGKITRNNRGRPNNVVEP